MQVAAAQAECAADLAAAEPVIAAAEAALSSLDKAALGELKSFSNPAAEVVQVSVCLWGDKVNVKLQSTLYSPLQWIYTVIYSPSKEATDWQRILDITLCLGFIYLQKHRF